MPSPRSPFRPMPPRTGGVAPALILALTLAACAHPRAAAQQDGAAPTREERAPAAVRLRVENHAPEQMRVFVHHDGQLTRIGEVAAATSQAFSIPSRLLGVSGEVRLAAEPVAAFSRYISETMVVRPGQMMVLTLERKLDTSSVGVRE